MKSKFKLRIPKPKIGFPQVPTRTWAAVGVVAVVLVAGLLLVQLLRTDYVEIPYSAFIHQVGAHNVSAISIKDERISGVFREPVPWPLDASSSSKTYDEFTTIVPLKMADNRLFPLLEQEDVTIHVVGSSGPWYVFPVLWGLPWLVLVATLWFVLRHTELTLPRVGIRKGEVEQVETVGESVADGQPRELETEPGHGGEQEIQPEPYGLVRSPETMSHVVGQIEAKRELAELVAHMKDADSSHDLQVHPPKAFLLIGQSGVGKTLLARAIAGETGMSLFATNLSELVEFHPILRRSLVHDLFRDARERAPAIVFLDEIDALGARRTSCSPESYTREEQLLREVVTELDSAAVDGSILVLAAARRLSTVSPVLRRPGRFERHVTLSLPGRTERVEILSRQFRAVSLSEDVDLEAIGRQTVGLSSADLVLLCNRATWQAGHDGHEVVCKEDIERTLAQLVVAGETSGQLLGRTERRIAAFHEAGHALLSLLLPEIAPPNKLSLLPGDDWSGLARDAVSNGHLHTKSDLMARLTVMLGGRSAEEIGTGDVSNEAEDDLEYATQLARRMAARWGMSDLGPVSFHLLEDRVSLSNDPVELYDYCEASAAQVDRAVRMLLEDRHAVARHILKNNRSLLEHLASLLEREETIQGETLVRVMDKVSSVASLDEPRSQR